MMVRYRESSYYHAHDKGLITENNFGKDGELDAVLFTTASSTIWKREGIYILIKTKKEERDLRVGVCMCVCLPNRG